MSPRRSTSSSCCAALGLLVTLSLTGCGGEEITPAGPRPELVQPSLPSVASGVGQEGVPRLVNLLLVDGQVRGVGEVVEIAQGVRLRLTVTADVADVLVVAGFDARVQLPIDKPVQLTLIADTAGDFPVSLESNGRVLTRLRVS